MSKNFITQGGIALLLGSVMASAGTIAESQKSWHKKYQKQENAPDPAKMLLKEHEAARGALKNEGWNRVTIEAKGKVVKTWINGVPASHWVGDGTYAKGFFGLQVHKAKKGEVHFRKLRVKELKASVK